MPQASPAGGLSLIIHILINVVLFLYRKLIIALNISEKNVISSYFERLTNKDGESAGRKILSYSVVFFIFVVMASNFVFITMKLFNLDKNGRAITQITNNFRIIMAPITDNTLKAEEVDGMNTAYSNGTFINAKNQAIISEELQSGEKITLIDFMDNVGIVDTSFEARANLAKELGAISTIEEYIGSARQDNMIINRIRDELRAYLESHNTDNIN